MAGRPERRARRGELARCGAEPSGSGFVRDGEWEGRMTRGMGVDRRERAPDFRFSLVGGREKRVTEQLAEAVFTVVGYRGNKTIAQYPCVAMGLY
jgi:hypothetical protein